MENQIEQALELQTLLVWVPQKGLGLELVTQIRTPQGPGLAYQRRTQARELQTALLK